MDMPPIDRHLREDIDDDAWIHYRLDDLSPFSPSLSTQPNDALLMQIIQRSDWNGSGFIDLS
jgi:hypothetical protein